MEPELYEKLKEHVSREATAAELRWPGVVEADDIEQELWLWILEDKTAAPYLDVADTALSIKVIRRQAERICSKERTDYDHFTGNFHYNTKDVQGILRQLSEGRTITPDESADFHEGMERLSNTNVGYFETLVELAQGHWKKYSKSNRNAKNNAIRALTEYMNRNWTSRSTGWTEGPGSKNLQSKFVHDFNEVPSYEEVY